MNTPHHPSRATHQFLFRAQAVQYAGNRQLGTILLTGFISHRLLTAFFIAVGALIVGFFVFFETTRTVRCTGVLLPRSGVVRIVSGQIGQIVESRVLDGQLVQKGEVLFVVSGERSSATVGSTQRTVSTLLQGRRDSFTNELSQSALQARQRIKTTQERVRELEKEGSQLRSQAELQHTRISLSEQAYKRYEELVRTNFISQAQLQEKQADVLDQHQRLAEIQRTASSSSRDLANAKAELLDLQIQAQRDVALLERNISAIQQDLSENEARRELVIHAPNAGTVTAITAEAGQTVAPDTVLAALLPAGAALEAEIYVPSRSVGFIKAGMTVMLRYQAYPYQKFGQHRAKVHEVASMSLRPVELNAPSVAASAGEPLYRIRLRLDNQNVIAYGKPMPLKAGMLIEASVELEHRRLYEWIFEPLFSISGHQ